MSLQKPFAGTVALSLALFACTHKEQPAAASGATGPQTRPASIDLSVWDAHRSLDRQAPALRTWHQGNNFRPYTDKQQWLSRSQYLREQVLVAAGLWPMPDRCPLKPVIHGRIERDDYTVEKVFFQSHPGFYVSGNLYRPKGKAGPFPGVLSPHGHWENGRFYRASDQSLDADLKGGHEKDPDAGRYPLQARCASLARMGCVVFHYDMVGYADSDPNRFEHRGIFRDAESELYGLSIFGLQTWNSIRSLDFLLSLPEVDKSRIACTGASGGGTQTFVLMAVEDRLTAAAPVCMISADEHQGGCICENGPLLRLLTDNVELAACFAPRPFIHPTATGDWTAHFMEKGYPQLQAIYRLFNAEQNVQAVRFKAGHNYNHNNREAVYNFFNIHLRLGQSSPVTEGRFTPIPPQELSVFTDTYPRPSDAVDPAGLKQYWMAAAKAQTDALKPRDTQSLEHFRQVVGSALRHMMATDLPARDDVAVQFVATARYPGFKIEKFSLSRRGSDRQIPAALFMPLKGKGSATLVIHPKGKAGLLDNNGMPGPILAGLMAKGQAVLAVDVFMTGELQSATVTPPPPDNDYFTTYNRTPLANRAHDILTALGYLKGRADIESINLIGLGRSGPWVLLARALAGDAVFRTVADASQFDFRSINNRSDENYLPMALRYGGLWPLASLAVPGEMLVFNPNPHDGPAYLSSIYAALGAARKLQVAPAVDTGEIVRWIAR